MPHTEAIEYERGLTFEKVWAALMEDKEHLKETRELVKEIAERQKETDNQIKETGEQIKKTGEQMKETDQKMGFLDNRFGELAQHLVAPNIMEKFNKLSFNFTKCSLNVKIKEPENPNLIAEVDILLENGDIVVAVEVKATPNEKRVNKHIERMEKLRLYADRHGDKRKYLGAIAGAILSEEIRRLILNQGFYLIEQTGDTVKITIPEGFKPREW